MFTFSFVLSCYDEKGNKKARSFLRNLQAEKDKINSINSSAGDRRHFILRFGDGDLRIGPPDDVTG